MNQNERERLAALLREAMPPVHRELDTDLWPRMLRELDRQTGPRPVPWFDWLLLAGAVSWCAAFPAALGALLYQL